MKSRLLRNPSRGAAHALRTALCPRRLRMDARVSTPGSCCASAWFPLPRTRLSSARQAKAFLLAAYDIRIFKVAEYDPTAPAALRAPQVSGRPAMLDPSLAAAGLALEPAPPGLRRGAAASACCRRRILGRSSTHQLSAVSCGLIDLRLGGQGVLEAMSAKVSGSSSGLCMGAAAGAGKQSAAKKSCGSCARVSPDCGTEAQTPSALPRALANGELLGESENGRGVGIEAASVIV